MTLGYFLSSFSFSYVHLKLSCFKIVLNNNNFSKVVVMNTFTFHALKIWNHWLISASTGVIENPFGTNSIYYPATSVSRIFWCFDISISERVSRLWLATQSVIWISALFTDSPPVPPSERRQTRVKCEQNVFPVCCRNKQRNFTTKQLFPKYTKKVTKFGLEVLTVKPCLFDLNLSIKPVKKTFVYKCKLS